MYCMQLKAHGIGKIAPCEDASQPKNRSLWYKCKYFTCRYLQKEPLRVHVLVSVSRCALGLQALFNPSFAPPWLWHHRANRQTFWSHLPRIFLIVIQQLSRSSVLGVKTWLIFEILKEFKGILTAKMLSQMHKDHLHMDLVSPPRINRPCSKHRDDEQLAE